jgi:hypothetical protein
MRRHPEIPFWLCVGDVGDDRGVYEPPPAPLYWIKGNNEDFDFIARLGGPGPAAGGQERSANASDAGGPLVENLYYLPNAQLVEIEGVRVAGVGGTFAPTWYDKKASELPGTKSTSGTRLQPRPSGTKRDDKRRHFVREEVEAVRRMRDLDVLLTHEAPRPYRVGGFDAGKTPVNEMIASAKPRLHLFGHHHRFSESVVSGVRSVCLDLASKSYLLVDRATLAYERLET